ncbi:MAG: nicotinate phosphoribosyltransferase [Candidatus Asgardarchaeia archaeon]
MRRFYCATEEEIKNGETTDVYFVRTEEVLRKKGLDKVRVIAEVTASSLPDGWKWGILSGVEEVAKLFEGIDVDVYSMPEGSVFYPGEPVMKVVGKYCDFARYETPLLGFICQSSGITTRSARIKKVAKDKIVLSFGIRRMHPAISPMIDRAAYIGGFDGFSSVITEKILGIPSSGTMPHALIIVFGDQRKAWKAFDEVLPKNIPRIALVDTYYDEKMESVSAAETLKDSLYGVRLDTPSSRRGNFRKIIEEVRWELDIRGYKKVKIIISGGINEEVIKELSDAPVDGFGVGTWVSNSPTIDFALDIVEIDGKFVAKRGKLGGSKQVWECPDCLYHRMTLMGEDGGTCPKCGTKMETKLKPLVKGGKIVASLPSVKDIRNYVLKQLEKLSLD